MRINGRNEEPVSPCPPANEMGKLVSSSRTGISLFKFSSTCILVRRQAKR